MSPSQKENFKTGSKEVNTRFDSLESLVCANANQIAKNAEGISRLEIITEKNNQAIQKNAEGIHKNGILLEEIRDTVKMRQEGEI